MINSEKELEDYICEHQEEFVKKLKDVLFLKDKEIFFIGRQIQIGCQNIADLVYYYDSDVPEEIAIKEGEVCRNYIIVELKNRSLETKDLAQIGRYVTTLYDKLENDNLIFGFEEIKGVLVGHGLDHNMQDVEMLLNQFQNNIYFMNIKTKIEFEDISYYHNEEYINNLVLDDRIKECCTKKVNENE